MPPSLLGPQHAFVPEPLYQARSAHYENEVQLHAVSNLSFMPAMELWQEARAIIDSSLPDQLEEEVVALVQRFARIVLDSISVETKSDAQRRAELARAGKLIGVGLFHGTNECFSDSLRVFLRQT